MDIRHWDNVPPGFDKRDPRPEQNAITAGRGWTKESPSR